jgi:hypothetical protein
MVVEAERNREHIIGLLTHPPILNTDQVVDLWRLPTDAASKLRENVEPLFNFCVQWSCNSFGMGWTERLFVRPAAY